MHSYPPSISKELENCVAAPKPAVDSSRALFSKYFDKDMNVCKIVPWNACVKLPAAQKFTQCLTLPQFKVTGTSAGNVLYVYKEKVKVSNRNARRDASGKEDGGVV